VREAEVRIGDYDLVDLGDRGAEAVRADLLHRAVEQRVHFGAVAVIAIGGNGNGSGGRRGRACDGGRGRLADADPGAGNNEAPRMSARSIAQRACQARARVECSHRPALG
jgi:hypothetical protein